MSKFVYERDYKTSNLLYEECLKWHNLGYRVFIQGYYAMNCKEFVPVKL